MFIVRTALAAFLSVALLAAGLAPATAQQRAPSLVRDAEIEQTIRRYASPLLQAAGFPPGDVRIHLVNDQRLNAFVAGGLNIFIHTGLLQEARAPGQVIGVLAHEIGHITGGHLSRLREEMASASAQSVIAAVLGVAAAVATGEAGLGTAVAAGGMGAVQRNFLSYNRTQEQAADQVALRLLDATGQSAQGLVEFLGIIADQELLAPSLQDPYLRTHPITQERVDVARRHVETSRWSDEPDPPDLVRAHERMRAKIAGFIDPPGKTLRVYAESDDSIPARYARAIAYYRRPDLGRAIPLIDGLIEEEPTDPFFHELKGQMLFENGRPQEALVAYAQAHELAPNEPLIMAELARVGMATGEDDWNRRAVPLLRRALDIEPRNGGWWRQLGIAYGRLGEFGSASLALAEAAVARGDPKEAQFHARKAQEQFERGSAGWIRAEDIRMAAARAAKEE